MADPAHPGEDLEFRRPVLSLARDIEAEESYDWHHHYRAQLVFASEGVMTVSTHTGTWVVPPEQAVWMPAGEEHQVVALGRLSMRSLYLHPDACAELPGEPRVLRVTRLLRELILRLAAFPTFYDVDGMAARLAAVIPDEIRTLEPEPLHLPLPHSRRLTAVTRTLIEEPADARPLSHWATVVGASERTLARHFLNETGMTFGAWRQRLRLVKAVERLAAGAPVTNVALDLGYESPSAFIAMFRRELGTTPGRYLRQGTASPAAE